MLPEGNGRRVFALAFHSIYANAAAIQLNLRAAIYFTCYLQRQLYAGREWLPQLLKHGQFFQLFQFLRLFECLEKAIAICRTHIVHFFCSVDFPLDKLQTIDTDIVLVQLMLFREFQEGSPKLREVDSVFIIKIFGPEPS